MESDYTVGLERKVNYRWKRGKIIEDRKNFRTQLIKRRDDKIAWTRGV